jgi:hypothetical protein
MQIQRRGEDPPGNMATPNLDQAQGSEIQKPQKAGGVLL